MNKKSLLKHLVFLMFFIFIADFLAHKFFWYSLIWYFDMIMHFLGGLWVGLFFIYVVSFKKSISYGINIFLNIIIATLIIGLLWELYEYYLNIVSGTDFILADTISDLLFDLFGSIVAILYFLKIIMRKTINKIQ